MPDPVQPKPKFGNMSKSLSDLRERYQRGPRATRDAFGNPWEAPKRPAAAAGPSESPTFVSPANSPVQSPLASVFARPRAGSNGATPPVRPPRAARKGSAPSVLEAPAVPTTAAVPTGQPWPCASWAPRLGPSARTPLALPPGLPKGSYPAHFDAATLACLRTLVAEQCRPATIEGLRAQMRGEQAPLVQAGRYVALHCIEKREQLARDQQSGLRDARDCAEHRAALLEMLQHLVRAPLPLGDRLREANQRRLAHFACLWADDQALTCLFGMPDAPMDLAPLFAIPNYSVRRFCHALRIDLSVKLPELEALCSHPARRSDAAVAASYCLIVRAFAAQVPARTHALEGFSEAFLMRGMYFFSCLAVHYKEVALIEGVLQASCPLGLQQHAATTMLHLCLQNGFFAGVAPCLKPEYEAMPRSRVGSVDGQSKMDFGFPADLTPLHLLARRSYDDDSVSEQEAVAIASALHESGADARALALVNLSPGHAAAARNALISPATLALIHNNMALAKCLSHWARHRDQQEKLAVLADRAHADPQNLRWRANLIEGTQTALSEAVERVMRRRRQPAVRANESLGVAADLEHLFVTLRQVFDNVFFYNLEHSFGLRDTAEVRFARAVSQLRAVTEMADRDIRNSQLNFDDVHLPRISRVLYGAQQVLQALGQIDVARSDRAPGLEPPSLSTHQQVLFDDGASNLTVLREDDALGTLRPFPLLATLPAPSLRWVEEYHHIDRQKTTYDCLAAFALSIGGAAPTPVTQSDSRSTGRVPALARKLLDVFDSQRKDWDVLLCGYLMVALRQRHEAAALAVVACAERAVGGLHKLPLEQLPQALALAIDMEPATLQALLQANRRGKGKWLSAWKNELNAAGETPLHLAARSQLDHAAQIINASRDQMRRLASVRDASHRTPAQVALACGHLHAFFALWELWPQLDTGVHITKACLLAFAGPGQPGLTRMASAPKADRLRSQLLPGLLMAAVWYDDKDCLAALLREVQWRDCIGFSGGENLLHLVATAHAPKCFDLLRGYQDPRLSPTGDLLVTLATRPDNAGVLPGAVAYDERLKRSIREVVKLRSPRSPPSLEAAPAGRGGSPLWHFQPKVLPGVELYVTQGVVALAQRPSKDSPELQRARFACQRQAAHMMLRQADGASRERIIETFLHAPQLLDWARPSALHADPAARENLAWELLMALDQVQQHKALGVRLAVLLPNVPLNHIEARVRRFAAPLGRFAASDALVLLQMRQDALALCSALGDAADAEVTLCHDQLRALSVPPAATPKGVACIQTRAVRFEMHRNWRNGAIEILDALPVEMLKGDACGYGQLRPIAQALT